MNGAKVNIKCKVLLAVICTHLKKRKKNDITTESQKPRPQLLSWPLSRETERNRRKVKYCAREMYIFNDAQCANGILIIQFEDDVHSYESRLKWQFGMKEKMWTGNEAK